ncbi:glycosyltransferase family 4 protein [Spirosoma sp. SC4-14]|uniref:glycosyltransferase family 4 protein n=1 Tax=Spirosoma sp. SC4-14 TaxID=3128900 RepID=UPI0030CD6E69
MNVLYLTFYYEPDLCAGSFRNTPLIRELASQLQMNDTIHVVTTQPNRYQSFKQIALPYQEWQCESGARVRIDRVAVPAHASGLTDQIRSFWSYYRAARQLTKTESYDLVVASSSRLFTAFVGAQLARRQKRPLFLDIRDLFRETILEMFGKSVLPIVLNPALRLVEQYTFGYATHINLVSEGFRSYFDPYRQATFSYFTNGIDEEFLNLPVSAPRNSGRKTILYAGNIGEGQGLHKLIPEAARLLADQYRFVIIGDGGAKKKLEEAIRSNKVTNVELRTPVNRTTLLDAYQSADYLLVHLNDLEAFRRVLPSKLFEYGATDKPILAGVAGYAAQFVRTYIDNHILFDPGDVTSLVVQLNTTPYRTCCRTRFVEQFQRKTIVKALAKQMLKTAAYPINHADAPAL